ncbi:MAG: hypothetical protein BGP10_12385 [Rhodanobacter sp. 68-29]|nr:hypothetical protein [Rhodanobacter sp.]ODV27985.1 MAG: hypothetical protein ABT19_00305 [Rhodanobacter sp. SCN 68-63]OJY60689.1 MAG: hypothetical protein BGP10_12385 [Rhodanobacter sp. 68-29]
MASGAAQKALIDKASRAARQRQIAYREQEAKAAQDLLQRIANAIKLELLSLQDGGRDVLPGDIPSLRAFLGGQTDELLQRYRAIVYRALPESARIGASVLPLSGSGLSVDVLVNQTMAWITSFRASDGLQLSDRLWRVASTAKTELGAAIENGIVRGQSSYQAAQEFIDRGAPVPSELNMGMAARQAATLAARAEQLLVNPSADVLYAAQRVIRTETNRAYTESYVASVAQHPDVIGVKFTLSPMHPKHDICDLYAAANLHGLGPGVYPPGDHPYPAHPNTLSYLQPVFADEVTDADRAGKQSAFDWLGKQDAGTQTAVLGGQKKADAFRAGQLHDSELLAPWYQIADRLGAQP